VEASGSVEVGSAEERGASGGECLVLESIEEGSADKDLRRKVHEDKTLGVWRDLADKRERGFNWRNGLLVKKELDSMSQPITLIILPKPYRSKVLNLAHEKCGPFAKKKTAQLIRRFFLCHFFQKM